MSVKIDKDFMLRKSILNSNVRTISWHPGIGLLGCFFMIQSLFYRCHESSLLCKEEIEKWIAGMQRGNLNGKTADREYLDLL